MSKISFIFPVYNEEESLHALFTEMQKLIERLPNDEVELVFIDDGSADRTYMMLTALGHEYPFVKMVSFSRNFGQQIALTAGLDYASGDAIIVMDADLQDPPNVALELISKWREGYAVVYAKRRTRHQEEVFLRKIVAHLYYRLLNALSDIPIPTDTGDFRLLDRKVVDGLKLCREHSRYIRGLTSFVGFTQTSVLYDRHNRFAGQSKYTLLKLFKLALDGIMSFSVKPLKVISYIGFFISLFSFLGATYITLKRIFFQQYTVPGFTLTIILLSFFSGMQILILGIIGEYIGRIYIEAQNRPLYLIKHKINFPDT
ncbi:hypothetical protein A3B21_00235 [Candidatus Uhrbacteria bacterium RIFCSPLOWO2_01_FULL_47_24]|uniref:Glycosyltransferase 2-like domain-containing protein n=1 Tax=Candidatus Uhrbacteria bacterium RIFCSPLOWO2_01_FULL_47_24 TaxID=1802401 RepID=A0A1F7USV9_9BACT|nr:MAG: hypothetical protein A2753_03865 [Candidatus Uhrbacteria bacterium RIFCSPHIGHO2_01_FULL_47_11]OGL68025.1 MAG: hypothetical protein A3D58_01610 [Candidatus Uhrbacteria bacterium RIFCSPHIGHO2_02_FULL_46_47]OGL75435.1 MAG: hypothetical protein A3F52_04955 [Candidatus Uhrbacteria bacterium RIFCSPHIGHO2_12_FULL_47_11]OGL81339.1 MAG: hypothetical protein A3B21_00235 [Candidatus Uhrbacteria bacterium RIFCSPLOWO2_01_FULL_47_24]OGL83917.1 MAG: hypothetical protein A3J03_00670 [Candidatus Uhrbact